jgi:APA family basic amino acid/polyamine antiporter
LRHVCKVDPPPPSQPPRSLRPLGFWMCLALVVGNMIGSGVYLLPGALAPFGWNGVFGWLVTIGGALCLAYVFGRLASRFPQAGGPYAYTREAFGHFPAFLVAWSYWVSLWVGNAAITTGVVAPLSTIFPAVGAHSALFSFAIVWGLIAVNCLGAKQAGQMQLATTILKILPLAAVTVLAALVVGGSSGGAVPPLRAAELSAGGGTGIMAAASLTLWAFLGVESATVPAEKVDRPERTIRRATLIGTALTGAIYLFACSAVALLLPPDQASKSGAPLADFVALHWGAAAGTALALLAAISAFGALNGWILLQGEMPWAMAKDGVLPGWLAQTSPQGTPIRASLVSGVLLSAVLYFNHDRSMTELFEFLIRLATTASLVAYLACALAALRLRGAGELGRDSLLPVVAVVTALFAAWAIWGSGQEAMLLGAALLASGVPVFLLMRRSLLGGQEAVSQGPTGD